MFMTLWLVVHQGQHNHTECILQLGMLEKLVQDNIGIGVPDAVRPPAGLPGWTHP